MITSTTDPRVFKQKALQWASSFDVFCALDSNHFNDPYSKFDTLIAAGVQHELALESGPAFDGLEQFRKVHGGWMVGFFGYDLKNEIEYLTSSHPEQLGFPDLYFFVPQHLIVIKGNNVEIISDKPQSVVESIEIQALPAADGFINPVSIKSRLTKQAYLNQVAEIKRHILRGDIYVTNFCQEFFAENTVIDPLQVFFRLNDVSPNPFSAFLRCRNSYALCASPERFMAKRGNKLISQPIKGTARRGTTECEDDDYKQQLRDNAKEQQENVMIVDLVRNDLTRSAREGTVYTKELFGIYSFKQVHQMISTIVCELRTDVSSVQAIRNTFPMGSMTGAPKVSAMRLMEQYENSRRGLYSGAIGYFSPDDDFDFNVVIRTLLYNRENGYLSFHAGSAITHHADAEKEYEECLLKAKAILEVLGRSRSSLQI